MAEALAAARKAWASADLGDSDEQAIWARYGGSFTRTDNDRRADALLFAKDAKDAKRFLEMVSPERRPAFAARIAMQTDAPDTDTLYRAAIGSVTTDAGLMMGRARYLRAKGYGRRRAAACRAAAQIRLSAGGRRTLLRHAPARGAGRRAGPQLGDRLCDYPAT